MPCPLPLEESYKKKASSFVLLHLFKVLFYLRGLLKHTDLLLFSLGLSLCSGVLLLFFFASFSSSPCGSMLLFFFFLLTPPVSRLQQQRGPALAFAPPYVPPPVCANSQSLCALKSRQKKGYQRQILNT